MRMLPVPGKRSAPVQALWRVTGTPKLCLPRCDFGKEPTWRSVIVLPDFPRYRELHAQTVGSLTAAQIEVWWIDQRGALSR